MRVLFPFLFLVLVLHCSYGQSFTGKKLPKRWLFYSAGAGYVDGTMQYFEGYNYNILYSNASSGLPIVTDWPQYSQLSTFPKWANGTASVQFADTLKKLRLRVSASYYARKDSMIYTSASGSDFVYGKIATERSTYGAIGIGLAKTTRKLFKCLYLYGGAEVQAGFSLSSKIDFLEYSFDVVQDTLGFMNEYHVKGRFRMVPVFSALLGMEIRPIPWIGLVLEAQSGIGVHYVINQSAFGISRTCLLAGLAFQTTPKQTK